MVQSAEKKSILVVDDEPYIIEMLKEYLTLEGYQVISALNGKDALIAYDRFRPAAVILDIRMPGIDGIDVLRRMKTSRWLSRVIVASAYGDREMINKAVSLGADAYLSKPVQLSSVLRTLEEVQAYNGLDG